MERLHPAGVIEILSQIYEDSKLSLSLVHVITFAYFSWPGFGEFRYKLSQVLKDQNQNELQKKKFKPQVKLQV